MKKVLFTLLGLGLLSLSAQVVNDKSDQNYQKLKIVIKNPVAQSSLKRDLGQGWFDYAKAYDPGLEANSFVSWIQPDTNLNIVSSTSTVSNISFMVLGRVNDPRDPVFFNNPVQYSRYNTYTWDSIRFQQFYIRNVDSTLVGATMVPVVDTVFIQYFTPTGMDNQVYWLTATPNIKKYASYPKVSKYSPVTKLNSGAFRTDTIFLTEDFADSINNTSVFGRSITLGVGITIPSSPTNLNANLACHSIFFKPMLPTVLGDTGLAFDNSTIYNKHNMYGLLLSSQTGLKVENTDQQAQNNSNITNYQVAYGQTVSIWKAYIPGTEFSNTIFDNTQYFLTSNNVAVNSVDAKTLASIYPNPSKENSEVLLTLNSTKNAAAVITVLDITGKVVKTINANIVNGSNTIVVSTEALSKGMYLVNLAGEGISSSSKLIIE